MTPDEARAAAALAGHAVAGAARTVEITHQAVSSRVLARLGLPQGPGLIRTGVYAAVRRAGPLVGAAAGHAAAARIDPAAAPVAATPRGGRLQAAVNGAVGDHLVNAVSPLAVRMSLRCNGRDVRCDREGLAAAYPDALPRVAVFVHGLCHDENAWTPPADAVTGSARPSHPERLATDTGLTSVVLRYNTGRHVSQNGAELAHLLSELCAAWPVPLTDLVLIGHSMGGLVIRSACAEAGRSDAVWPSSTRLVVTLGTPHTGAPLEQFAAATARQLDRVEVTRGLARLFHARSSGIKDLRRGYTSAAEWSGCDQDSCPHDHRVATPPLDSADHLVVASTVTRDPRHPVGRAVGDILVRTGSALGHPGDDRGIGFHAGSGHVVGGVTHLGLLHDPRVYAAIRARTIAAVG
jgi:hypothetical protein